LNSFDNRQECFLSNEKKINLKIFRRCPLKLSTLAIHVLQEYGSAFQLSTIFEKKMEITNLCCIKILDTDRNTHQFNMTLNIKPE
jgi:hypothetical protein